MGGVGARPLDGALRASQLPPLRRGARELHECRLQCLLLCGGPHIGIARRLKLRTTGDDPEAECDLRSCENGYLSAFLVQVEKGNVTGWDLSFPLGTTSGASSAGRGSLASLALSVAAACFAVRLA